MIPQILVLGILFMALGIDLVRHGKTHEVTENFWTTLLSFVIWKDYCIGDTFSMYSGNDDLL
jgi:hypothetical protein